MEPSEPTELLERITKMEALVESALTTIQHFRPLVNATRTFLEYPVRAHECPGFDCATCPPRGEIERALEGIADMVADADAEAGG